MQSLTLLTICDSQYQATILANSDYLPFTQTDIEQKYLKESLVKINSGTLVEDYLTQIYQVELQRMAYYKKTAKVV